MNEKAANYLLGDRLQHIDMLEELTVPGVKVLYAGDDGVLLQSGDLFQLSARPGTKGRFEPLLLSALPETGECMVTLHTPELVAPLLSRNGFSLMMDCRNCVYDAPGPVAYCVPRGVEIRPLERSHLDFVLAHYHTVDDADYIRERIDAGMFGAFADGTPAGFIGTHDERSIGMLEVLPDYQRRGLAFALEARMINHLLSAGRVPFCQVEVHNAASFALQRKLGLTVSTHMIHWLERKNCLRF
jgi:tRNA (guanine37-N1)-methyltransferase